jgi:glycosyltransferase involved in cell wall biosynthesis
LTVYLHPESAPRGKTVRFYPVFAFALRHSLQSADAILTSSRVAAAEISHAFPRVASRISVVPVPVNPLFFQALDPDEVARARREYAPAGRLILYVGRLNPYKNPVSLVKAVAQLRGRGLDVGLVIAGREDSYYHAPEQAARELGIEQFVRRTGYVEISTLRALLQAADVLVLPSTFEGFGLPPVEAMASGTPVVCANRASLPEILGDAALLVEPEDPASIAAGIERVLTEPSLRAEMVRRGRQRAQLFTRETAGEQVRAVYRRLLSS